MVNARRTSQGEQRKVVIARRTQYGYTAGSPARGRLWDMHIPDIAIRDTEIRLGQFIKLANLVETGGLAKELIAAGAVQVNGHTDTRRGKVLRDGDEVTLIDLETQQVQAGARVATPGGAATQATSASGAAATNADNQEDDDLGEYFDEATADDDFDPEKWRNL